MINQRLQLFNHDKLKLTAIFVLFLGIAAIFSGCLNNSEEQVQTATSWPTWTPEPIVPTRTPTPPVTFTPIPSPTTTATPPVTLTPEPSPTVTPTFEPSPTSSPVAAGPSSEPEQGSQESIPHSELERFGLTGGLPTGVQAQAAGLPFGALLNWLVAVDVPASEFVFWQMVRTEEDGIRRTTWEEIEQAIEANPGSYWLVGNEPDVRWQDNVTPQRYAEIYHDVYIFIKERDPQAKVVIGGVTQPTPLRRAYLDLVLDTYQENYGVKMPIDIWNVHAFTLREERNSWGVDIPPGMDDDLAIAYEIEDHDDLEILRENLIDFRAWMVERGYGDKPLIISEYGILMPEDYGFPLERVAGYLTGSMDLFQTLSGENGYQADGGRFVQQWFWYSLHDGELYPTGNLFSPQSGELTPLGHIWTDYVTDSVAENDETP